jgi:hypothetical protein
MVGQSKLPGAIKNPRFQESGSDFFRSLTLSINQLCWTCEESQVIDRPTSMNTTSRWLKAAPQVSSLAILAGLAALATGCVEHQVKYVPVYPARTVYQVQPAPPPVVVQSQPVTVQAPPPSVAAPAPPPPKPAPPQQVVTQTVVVAPPKPPVEVIPVAPGPMFVWTPGYWRWQGQWVWVRGTWVVPPYHRAVWVNGYWAHRHGGYVWVPGHWR